MNNKKLDYNLTTKNDDKKNPELTVQMFFEFMRTAYQVNDSFDELSAVLTANSEIDWNQLAKINLNNNESSNEKSTDTDSLNENDNLQIKDNPNNDDKITDNLDTKSKTNNNKNNEIDDSSLSKLLKTNLSDILHEGLLDSVLPYMIPKQSVSQPIIKKPVVNNEPKKTSSLIASFDKSLTSSIRDKERNKLNRKILETEVEIHVCDEAKNIKKDFRCPQNLLIQKMCYFGDVTAGQKLEEMDISVHCDIIIFDWLMRWVKKDIIKKCEWPILEANNVIPITVSASFLQMEPLLEQCLIFCHENMTDVLKTPTILTCLNDNIFTKLSNLFTNIDVEKLKDKKDKVQSRLFCKLILSLVDPSPDNKKGHYSSLSSLFKCSKCHKYVIQLMSNTVPCISSSMKIDNKGNIYSKHTRDMTWTLNDYIVNLKNELRTWRKVYWHLWGDCHFITCRQCEISFPINQMDWCCYHPDKPQFFANEQHRGTSFPIGRYPCCSQRAYRFEVLINREGCRHKEHIPKITADYDGHVLNIFSMYRDIISLDPPQKFYPEKITRLATKDSSIPNGKLLCKEVMWWDGIELVPSRPKLGLLGKFWGGVSGKKNCSIGETRGNQKKHLQQQNSQVENCSKDSLSSSESDDDDAGTAGGGGGSSIDEDSDNSEESHAWKNFKPVEKIKSKFGNPVKRYYLNFVVNTIYFIIYFCVDRNEQARSWNMNLLVRYNQDNQRDFEERAAAQMIALLTKRNIIESNIGHKSQKNHHYYGHQLNHRPIGILLFIN